MLDLVYVAMTVAFFLVALAYVRVCDRGIGGRERCRLNFC